MCINRLQRDLYVGRETKILVQLVIGLFDIKFKKFQLFYTHQTAPLKNHFLNEDFKHTTPTINRKKGTIVVAAQFIAVKIWGGIPSAINRAFADPNLQTTHFVNLNDSI